MAVFNLFANLGLCNMTVPSVCIAKVNKKLYQYITFSTKSLTEWNSLYALWYKDGKKVIHPCVRSGAGGGLMIRFYPRGRRSFNSCEPCSLTHGDGGWTGKGIHLATNAFREEDVRRLIAVLNRKFGLSCTWHNTNRIYIPVKSAVEFCKIVYPHMEEGMLYKVDKNIKKPILSSTPPNESDS